MKESSKWAIAVKAISLVFTIAGGVISIIQSFAMERMTEEMVNEAVDAKFEEIESEKAE